ncbi:MAG TPA: LLM class flavin-dependent oxidoreductase [Dehalococcoidia bacterium]|nr:LLM class flavin-dependent oxidoreductase [Dehalococcoidia bacterium]
MKFGILYELQMQKPWNGDSEFRTYHDALEQVELADKVGFDYLWEVEHHFLAEYSHSSAPEVFLAAASQRTKNIRIGHGVALLPSPFNHPIRVAERAAALDIVSNGRVELGTGRSITEQELGGFGIDPADSRPMWEEAVRMIPKMWTQETFTWEGAYFVVPPRNVIPKPIQKPHPPMWMACTQPDSFRIAGECGLGALSFGFIAPGVLEASLNIYRQNVANAKPVGEFVNNQFAATTMALVAPTDEEAIEYGKPGADFFAESIATLFIPWGKKKDAPESYQYYVSLAQMVEQRLQERPSFEEQFESGALCMGSVERCRRVVERYAATGVDQLIVMCQVARIPHEKVMQTIRLFGEEIIPQFK